MIFHERGSNDTLEEYSPENPQYESTDDIPRIMHSSYHSCKGRDTGNNSSQDYDPGMSIVLPESDKECTGE